MFYTKVCFGIVLAALQIMLLHFTSQGQVVDWIDHIGGSNWNSATCVTSDGESVYVGGTTKDTTVFLSQPSIPFFTTSSGTFSGFVAKYTSQGSLIWYKIFGGNNYNQVSSIAVDSLGFLSVSGNFEGTVDFDSSPSISARTSKGGKDAFLCRMDANGNFQWVWAYGGNGFDDITSICTDEWGSTYVVGNFQDTVDFDSGPDENILGVPYASNFVAAKLDQNGNLVWVFSPGSGGGSDIILTPTGNLLLAGIFCDSADFEPGPGVQQLFSYGWPNGCQTFLAEYDLMGQLNWVEEFGIVNFHTAPKLAVSPDGHIYATARSNDTEFSSGDYDAYVIKFNQSGSAIWEKWIDGDAVSFGQSIAATNDRIFLSVTSVLTADFDPGPGVLNLTSASNGGFNPFICEWTTNGTLVQVHQFETSIESYATVIHLDNHGNLYIAGTFIGTINLGMNGLSQNFETTGSLDGYALKINTNTSIGIQSNGQENGWQVSPNPTSGEVVLRSNIKDDEIVVNIFNYQGQLISSETHFETSSLSLIIEGEPGVYLIDLISTSGFRKSTKVLKQ